MVISKIDYFANLLHANDWIGKMANNPMNV